MVPLTNLIYSSGFVICCCALEVAWHVPDLTSVFRSFMGEMQEKQLEQLIDTIKHLDLEERIKSVSTIVHNFSWNGRKDLEKHWFATVDLVKELVQIRKNAPSESSSVEFFDFIVKETTADQGKSFRFRHHFVTRCFS